MRRRHALLLGLVLMGAFVIAVVLLGSRNVRVRPDTATLQAAQEGWAALTGAQHEAAAGHLETAAEGLTRAGWPEVAAAVADSAGFCRALARTPEGSAGLPVPTLGARFLGKRISGGCLQALYTWRQGVLLLTGVEGADLPDAPPSITAGEQGTVVSWCRTREAHAWVLLAWMPIEADARALADAYEDAQDWPALAQAYGGDTEAVPSFRWTKPGEGAGEGESGGN